jgi:hypothetical protein
MSSGERRRLSVWKGRSVDNGARFGDRIRGDRIHISELLCVPDAGRTVLAKDTPPAMKIVAARN